MQTCRDARQRGQLRDGKATVIGSFDNQGEREFVPPDKGEMLDWVLVLDDEAKQFPAS